MYCSHTGSASSDTNLRTAQPRVPCPSRKRLPDAPAVPGTRTYTRILLYYFSANFLLSTPPNALARTLLYDVSVTMHILSIITSRRRT
jgi:hypothetical protein